jgi:hypothetical protein
LRQQCIGITVKQVLQRKIFLEFGAKIRAVDAACSAFLLYNHAHLGEVVPQCHRGAQHAISPRQLDFECHSAVHYSQLRNQAIVWRVDMPDHLPRRVQDGAGCHFYRIESGREARHVFDLQGGQQVIADELPAY